MKDKKNGRRKHVFRFFFDEHKTRPYSLTTHTFTDTVSPA